MKRCVFLTLGGALLVALAIWIGRDYLWVTIPLAAIAVLMMSLGYLLLPFAIVDEMAKGRK